MAVENGEQETFNKMNNKKPTRSYKQSTLLNSVLRSSQPKSRSRLRSRLKRSQEEQRKKYNKINRDRYQTGGDTDEEGEEESGGIGEKKTTGAQIANIINTGADIYKLAGKSAGPRVSRPPRISKRKIARINKRRGDPGQIYPTPFLAQFQSIRAAINRQATQTGPNTEFRAHLGPNRFHCL